MTDRPRPARGRPREGALDREQVLAAALVLFDREGLEALTMRRLAEVLRVSPMALYNHVRGKQDLLRGLAERLVGGMDVSCDDPDWRERIRVCFRRLRTAIRAHPDAVRLMERLPDAPLAVFRPLEVTLAALAEAGVAGEAALRAYFLLTNFTLGQVSYEVRGPFDGLDPAKAVDRGQLRGAGFERIERAVSPEPWDFDAAFEFGLEVILAGLEQRASAAGRGG